MTTAITVRGDLSRIERALREEPKIAKAAALSAVNRTVALAQTAGVRELSRVKAVPVRALRARTRIIKAARQRLYGQLITLTAGLPIDQLPYRQAKAGITAAGKRYRSAFVAKGLGGTKPLVFERREIGGKRAPRLPIDRVKIALNPEADAIFGRVTAQAVREQLPRLFDSQMAYRLARRG